MRKIIYGIVLAATLGGAAFYFYKISTVPEAAFELMSPQAGMVVESPLKFMGRAPGNWFFEATLPVHVADANGKVLGSGQAMAKGDWMTAGLVEFFGEINFEKSGTENGKIVFEKDNPSGLTENVGSFELPIKFTQFSGVGAPPFARMNLKVFFGNRIYNPQAGSATQQSLGQVNSPQVADCKKVFSVTRSVPQTLGVARMALEQLLQGPTESEKKSGYITSLSSGATVDDLSIENGLAKVDFNAALNNVGGSCAVAAIRAQIEQTLRQFSTVKEVVISVNGNTAGALQP